MRTITQGELRAMLADPTVSEEALRPYVAEYPERSRAYAPALRPNPATVTDQGREGDVLMAAFNSFSRRSRWRRYRQKIAQGWEGLRIVSEGDSWFQYPILLDDVIDQLWDAYAIRSLGAAGDLLADILAEDELGSVLEEERPDVFMISGGGNDLVGGGRLSAMVRSFDPSLAPGQYPTEAFADFLGDTMRLYRRLFQRLGQQQPELKILTHGYDRAIPAGGRWLGRPLERNGITEPGLQRAIVAVLIDRFNEELIQLAREFDGRVFHVDCRGIVQGRWHDELHPTDEGYAAVSQQFRSTIERAARQGRPPRVPQRFRNQGEAAMKPDVETIQDQASARYWRAQTRRDAAGDALEQGDPLQADSAERAAVRRRLLPARDGLALERVLGKSNLFHVNYFDLAAAAARAVCKIHVRDDFGVPLWSGTGFIVAPGLLLTNNHVLDSALRRGRAEFDYEFDVDFRTKPSRSFELEPERLFVTDPRLDFTFVGVARVAHDGTPLESFGTLRLVPDSGKALIGEPVSIIQHPDGELKRVALRDSYVQALPAPPDDDFIHYTTDTNPGSSGAPVVNDQMQVVALHHASVPDNSGGWVANEGVRVSRIFLALRAGAEGGGDDERSALEALGFRGTAGAREGASAPVPVTRAVSEAVPFVPASAPQRDVRTYIASLPIGPIRGMRELAGAPGVDVGDLPDGIVAGSDMIEFTPGVQADVRSAVALSLLAAQRVASNDTVAVTPDQWVGRRNTVLRNLGWLVEESGTVDREFEELDVAVHEAILPFLTAALGPGAAAASLILTALTQLQEMNKDDPWISLFERESHRFEVTEYQFGRVETEDGHTVIRLAAARLDASYGRTQVLFFRVRDGHARFQAGRSTLRTDTKLLQEMNDALRVKLGTLTQDFIQGLPIG